MLGEAIGSVGRMVQKSRTNSSSCRIAVSGYLSAPSVNWAEYRQRDPMGGWNPTSHLRPDLPAWRRLSSFHPDRINPHIDNNKIPNYRISYHKSDGQANKTRGPKWGVRFISLGICNAPDGLPHIGRHTQTRRWGTQAINSAH